MLRVTIKKCYAGGLPSPFLTITEIAKLTGKSRRTILRFAHQLAQTHPDQVMREKTPRGYIWQVSQDRVEQAFGEVGAPAKVVLSMNELPAPVAVPQPAPYMEMAIQRYTGMMAMHEKVKQQYEERLKGER